MAAWSQAKSRTCDFSSGPGVKFSSGRIYISATFADSWWHFYIPPKLAADFLHREVPGIYIYIYIIHTCIYIHNPHIFPAVPDPFSLFLAPFTMNKKVPEVSELELTFLKLIRVQRIYRCLVKQGLVWGVAVTLEDSGISMFFCWQKDI